MKGKRCPLEEEEAQTWSPGSSLQGAPRGLGAQAASTQERLQVGPCSAEKSKQYQKLLKGPSAFHYHLTLAILNSISEKMLLPPGQTAPTTPLPQSAPGPQSATPPPPRAPR